MNRVCLLIVLALATGAETDAFVPLRTNSGVDEIWDLDTTQANVIGGKVTYYLDPAGTSDLSASDGLAAVRAGIESWAKAPHSALRFLEDKTRPATKRKSGDRINYIHWASGELGPFVFGSTWPTFRDGHLVDADIVMNEDVRLTSTLSLSWSRKEPGGVRTADIQGVIAHEWGHAIGLDHEAIHGATMYYAASAGSTYFRTLHTDDLAAVEALYPSGDYERETGEIRGVANVEGRSNDRGVHVIAIDASSGEIVTGAMSEPDGRYRIRALMPGGYHVVAAPFNLLGTINTYWGSSDTGFLPSVLTHSGLNGDFARVIRVTGGETVSDADFSLGRRSGPFEPNDGPDQATPLFVGDGLAARMESGDDEDWYSFEGMKGQRIYARVHSLQIGGDVDPSLQLLDRGGARVLKSTGDIRDPVLYANRIEGPDTDARIQAYTLPAKGTYYLRVREQSLFGGAGNSYFYVLTLGQDPEAPSPTQSDYSITPDAISADGKSTAEIRVTPRNSFGDALGEAVTVALSTIGGGKIGPVTYRGGGVFGATLTAASGGPEDSIDVTMTYQGQTTGVPGALKIRYVGIVDPVQSEFLATPRRIPADGATTATLVLTPRDETGWPVGAGRSVSFSVAGTLPSNLTAVTDRGDGSYVATIRAATSKGSVAVTARVDGTDIGRTIKVFFGFDLLDVVTEVGIESEDLAATPDLVTKVTKKLASAAARLATARSSLLSVIGSDVDALKDAAKAARNLTKAHKKGKGDVDLIPALTELATAARETARAAIDGAGASAADAKLLKQLEQAEKKLAAGDEALGAGKYERAINRYRSALKKAVT